MSSSNKAALWGAVGLSKYSVSKLSCDIGSIQVYEKTKLVKHTLITCFSPTS